MNTAVSLHWYHYLEGSEPTVWKFKHRKWYLHFLNHSSTETWRLVQSRTSKARLFCWPQIPTAEMVRDISKRLKTVYYMITIKFTWADLAKLRKWKFDLQNLAVTLIFFKGRKKRINITLPSCPKNPPIKKAWQTRNTSGLRNQKRDHSVVSGLSGHPTPARSLAPSPGGMNLIRKMMTMIILD